MARLGEKSRREGAREHKTFGSNFFLLSISISPFGPRSENMLRAAFYYFSPSNFLIIHTPFLTLSLSLSRADDVVDVKRLFNQSFTISRAPARASDFQLANLRSHRTNQLVLATSKMEHFDASKSRRRAGISAGDHRIELQNRNKNSDSNVNIHGKSFLFGFCFPSRGGRRWSKVFFQTSSSFIKIISVDLQIKLTTSLFPNHYKILDVLYLAIIASRPPSLRLN